MSASNRAPGWAPGAAAKADCRHREQRPSTRPSRANMRRAAPHDLPACRHRPRPPNTSRRRCPPPAPRADFARLAGEAAPPPEAARSRPTARQTPHRRKPRERVTLAVTSRPATETSITAARHRCQALNSRSGRHPIHRPAESPRSGQSHTAPVLDRRAKTRMEHAQNPPASRPVKKSAARQLAGGGREAAKSRMSRDQFVRSKSRRRYRRGKCVSGLGRTP